MDDLRDITLFADMARARSFSAAAARLTLPASTLSRRIAELQRGWGTKFLHRTTRRVDLTEAGTLFLARCEQIVAAARHTRQDLCDLTQTPRGTLHLSVTPDFGTSFLAPMLASFGKTHPGLGLHLGLSPARVDMLGGA